MVMTRFEHFLQVLEDEANANRRARVGFSNAALRRMNEARGEDYPDGRDDDPDLEVARLYERSTRR